MHCPLSQRPHGQHLPRLNHMCKLFAGRRPSALCQQAAKPPSASLGTLQGIPRASLSGSMINLQSKSYRFVPFRPTKHCSLDEPQKAQGNVKVSSRPNQIPLLNVKDAVFVVQRAKDQLLAKDRIPREGDVLAVLRDCSRAATLVHDASLNTLVSRQLDESDTAASSLASLDRSSPDRTHCEDTKVSEILRPSDLVDRLSEAAFTVVSYPTVPITPKVLDVYIQTQARLGRVETLPHVLSLYASKPRPRVGHDTLQDAHVQPNVNHAANAVDPIVIDKALDAAIEAKNLDAAIGIIANGYATKAFARAKLLKKVLLPASVVVATPLIGYLLASHLSYLQNSLDHKTATAVNTIGILTYVGFTSCIAVLFALTQNDHMKRVIWAPGTPLMERYVREDERAALDKVACSFGFSQARRHGEEDGDAFRDLRTFILMKGMVLDSVHLMEGMS